MAASAADERYTPSEVAEPETTTLVDDKVAASARWKGTWAEQFPLRAKGRNLVNTRGERFKLCGINWYGASDALHVVGGLCDRPLADICAAVRS
jgi:hypothetical protein